MMLNRLRWMSTKESLRTYKESSKMLMMILRRKEQVVVSKIATELRDVVEKLGKELGYNIIFEKRESGVLYNMESADITKLAIDRYNKEWKSKKK